MGASDLDQIDASGALVNVSAAHKAFDSKLVKKMGKPFDFDLGVSLSDLPTEFNPLNYIGYASIANTLYELFNVTGKNWKAMRNGPDARTVKSILA